MKQVRMAPEELNTRMAHTEKRRIQQRLHHALDETLLSLSKGPVALCVSGGLDSRALMEAVAPWPNRHLFDFRVVCVDHQTRASAADEARSVAARAQVLGFRTEVLRIAPARHDEATLRGARYKAIEDYLLGAGGVGLVCAHQLDDDAEGFVLDLFGKGGARHGGSMGPVAKWGDLWLARPFLELSRKELLMYLTAIGALDYVVDPSNEQSSYARSHVRKWLSQSLILHPQPHRRIKQVMDRQDELKTAVMSDALALIGPLEQGSIVVRYGPQTHEAVFKEALHCALKQLSQCADLRSGGVTITQIAKKLQKLGLLGAKRVDQRLDSITVGSHFELKFDLPGVRAIIDQRRVVLRRT